MKQITILANSTRDQEGYSDTSIGVSLDIECELSDVGSIIIALRKIEKDFKELYPPYSKTEIEPDVTYREEPNCHMFYRFTLSSIVNDQTSTLHNISSLMSAYVSYSISSLFREMGFNIVDDNDNSISDKSVAREICNAQMDSFLWFVSDSLYQMEIIEYTGENETEFLAQFENKDFFIEAMKMLGDELDGEFGFSAPMDESIPFKDYNPFNSSKKSIDFISQLCKNIKYSKLIDFFNTEIKEDV